MATNPQKNTRRAIRALSTFFVTFDTAAEFSDITIKSAWIHAGNLRDDNNLNIRLVGMQGAIFTFSL
jgi:2-hydroxychromene-2-carboxylate isomerase